MGANLAVCAVTVIGDEGGGLWKTPTPLSLPCGRLFVDNNAHMAQCAACDARQHDRSCVGCTANLIHTRFDARACGNFTMQATERTVLSLKFKSMLWAKQFCSALHTACQAPSMTARISQACQHQLQLQPP
jgi:hypothetical protein